MEIVKEAAIVESINYIELLKVGLKNAVGYSIYEASDDVLTLGGICEHSIQSTDSGYCSEDCKIPAETPTFTCIPWWKVYDEIYAPTRVKFEEYMTNRTLQNSEGYANMLEVEDLKYRTTARL